MSPIITTSFFVFGSGILSWFLNINWILLILLSLEIISSGVYLTLLSEVSTLALSISCLPIFSCFSVCESVLGLSILVSLTRQTGNGSFTFSNLL